jgi:hypothetical protein
VISPVVGFEIVTVGVNCTPEGRCSMVATMAVAAARFCFTPALFVAVSTSAGSRSPSAMTNAAFFTRTS